MLETEEQTKYVSATIFPTRPIIKNRDVNSTHPSTAVFKQDVDVIFILEVVVEVNDVFVMQGSVQFDFSVDLSIKRLQKLN